HVFEDLHLFTADGVPPSLMPDMVRLLQDPSMEHFQGAAFGLDQRRGEYTTELKQALHLLVAQGFRPMILFLEADPAVIMRRYATTRRPHPLEREGVGLEQAVKEEVKRLLPIRELADRIIDTSSFSIHDLRRVIQRRWNNAPERLRSIKVNLVSFGFKYGVPREADMVFDLRFLPNPYFVEELRAFSGKDKRVAAYVFNEPKGLDFKKRLIDFMIFLLPLYDAEGRYRITIALGCTGGKHRSVAMTEALARALKRQDYAVSVEHRHMELG
ncbi:MAG: RNase adapter RapZ, partial [Bilophila sp.]